MGQNDVVAVAKKAAVAAGGTEFEANTAAATVIREVYKAHGKASRLHVKPLTLTQIYTNTDLLFVAFCILNSINTPSALPISIRSFRENICRSATGGGVCRGTRERFPDASPTP
jgi:hypothetical protein